MSEGGLSLSRASGEARPITPRAAATCANPDPRRLGARPTRPALLRLLPETTRWAQWIVAARRGRFPRCGRDPAAAAAERHIHGRRNVWPLQELHPAGVYQESRRRQFLDEPNGAACNDGLTHRLRAAFSAHEAKRLRWEFSGGVGPGWELYCVRPVYHLDPAMRPRWSSWSKSGPYR